MAMTPSERLEMMDRMNEEVIVNQYEKQQGEFEVEEEQRLRDEKGRFASKKDLSEDEEDLEAAADEDLETESEEEQESEAEEEQAEEEADEPAKILSKKVKAKVDGSEEEVSVEEMLRVYQKNKAADERLRRASEMEKELAQRQSELLELQQRMLEAAKRPEQEEKQPAGPSKEELDVDREFMEAIFSGDEEKASKALAKRDQLVERRLRESLTKQTTEIEQRALERAQQVVQKKSWEDYISELAERRDDVAEDPFLTQVFNTHLEQQVKAKGMTKAAIAEAEKAYDEWAAKRGILPKAKAKQEEQQKPEKKDFMETRKARAEKSKRLSVGTSASAKGKAEQEETYKQGAELVQDMIKQRQPWRS